MDKPESITGLDTIEVTRRTVIETGTSALLLTALPRAAFAAGPADDDASPRPGEGRTSDQRPASIRLRWIPVRHCSTPCGNISH